MDMYDSKILRELRQNGRLTNQELAERIGLSPSPCHRRVRNLEAQGIIAGYTAIIDQSKLGYEVNLFIRVKINRHANDTVENVEKGLRELEEVVFCFLISGSYDYLLFVRTKTLNDYEKFLRKKLHYLEGIAEIDTGFAYGCVKAPFGLAF